MLLWEYEYELALYQHGHQGGTDSSPQNKLDSEGVMQLQVEFWVTVHAHTHTHTSKGTHAHIHTYVRTYKLNKKVCTTFKQYSTDTRTGVSIRYVYP